MLGRLSLLLFSISFLYALSAEDIQVILQKKVWDHLTSTRMNPVTVNIIIAKNGIPDTERISAVETDAIKPFGYNTAKAFINGQGSRTFEYWIHSSFLIPVAARQMKPGQIIVSEDIVLDWVSLEKESPFVILRPDKLMGMNVKYFKQKGSFFQDMDLSMPEVIKAQSECRILLINGKIMIQTKGIALKNGAVGSKIGVIVHDTQKKLIGQVIDSQNVEVKINP